MTHLSTADVLTRPSHDLSPAQMTGIRRDEDTDDDGGDNADGCASSRRSRSVHPDPMRTPFTNKKQKKKEMKMEEINNNRNKKETPK